METISNQITEKAALEELNSFILGEIYRNISERFSFFEHKDNYEFEAYQLSNGGIYIVPVTDLGHVCVATTVGHDENLIDFDIQYYSIYLTIQALQAIEENDDQAFTDIDKGLAEDNCFKLTQFLNGKGGSSFHLNQKELVLFLI